MKEKRVLAIIGTAGRKNAPLTREHWEFMVDRGLHAVRALKPDSLVSGGAAWADHVAVAVADQLELALELHIPNGAGAPKAYAAARHHHSAFSRVLGRDTWDEVIVHHAGTVEYDGPGFDAFFQRNKVVAEAATHILAFHTDRDADALLKRSGGGTPDTWRKFHQKCLREGWNPQERMVYVNLDTKMPSVPSIPGPTPKMAQQLEQVPAFRNCCAFLSNFFPAEVALDGVFYPTVEHAFQAAKFPQGSEARENIRLIYSPGGAKALGRQPGMRSDWEQVKTKVMLDLLRHKFDLPELHDQLLQTGDLELVEHNTWGDEIWGVYWGRGENHLGKLLMQIRDEIRNR